MRSHAREREREREMCVCVCGGTGFTTTTTTSCVWHGLRLCEIKWIVGVSLSLLLLRSYRIYILYIYIICAARGQPCVGAARVWWWYDESLSHALSVRCVCVCGSCACTRYLHARICIGWGRAERDTDRP